MVQVQNRQHLTLGGTDEEGGSFTRRQVAFPERVGIEHVAKEMQGAYRLDSAKNRVQNRMFRGSSDNRWAPTWKILPGQIFPGGKILSAAGLV